MPTVLEVDVQTGIVIEREMNAQEIAQSVVDTAEAEAAKAAEAQRVATPTLEQIVAQLQAEVAALKGA